MTRMLSLKETRLGSLLFLNRFLEIQLHREVLARSSLCSQDDKKSLFKLLKLTHDHVCQRVPPHMRSLLEDEVGPTQGEHFTPGTVEASV